MMFKTHNLEGLLLPVILTHNKVMRIHYRPARQAHKIYPGKQQNINLGTVHIHIINLLLGGGDVYET